MEFKTIWRDKLSLEASICASIGNIQIWCRWIVFRPSSISPISTTLCGLWMIEILPRNFLTMFLWRPLSKMKVSNMRSCRRWTSFTGTYYNSIGIINGFQYYVLGTVSLWINRDSFNRRLSSNGCTECRVSPQLTDGTGVPPFPVEIVWWLSGRIDASQRQMNELQRTRE